MSNSNYKLIIAGYRYNPDFIRLKKVLQENPPECDLVIKHIEEEGSSTYAELYRNGQRISTWYGYIDKRVINNFILKTNYERVG